MSILPFALSTRWNAGRHTSGEALIEEILELGFTRVELGYDLRMDLVPGVKAMIDQGAVKVGTVHNFCPVPMGASRGHPELFTFASKDPDIRKRAVQHTTRTIEFAVEVGADTVVSHSGNVDMKRMTMELIALMEQGRQQTPQYEKKRLKLQMTREKKARKQLGFLKEGVERMLPVLQEHGVVLALENLPTWEAFPTEMEIMDLLKQYGSSGLRYWHDLGHGQIRENMGMIHQVRWLERLQPWLAGMHVHDVAAPAQDHVMPPHGNTDFQRFIPFGTLPIHRVVEPTPKTPPEIMREALVYLKEQWGAGEPDPPTSEQGDSAL